MPEPNDTVLHEMANRAKRISARAYCPYSKFRVGAVVLTDGGDMFEGCNVENASYGLTICAERNAVFQMVARAEQKIAAVVIYTPTPTPSAPCGACRQILWEFCGDIEVILVNPGGKMETLRMKDLFPRPFDASFL